MPLLSHLLTVAILCFSVLWEEECSNCETLISVLSFIAGKIAEPNSADVYPLREHLNQP